MTNSPDTTSHDDEERDDDERDDKAFDLQEHDGEEHEGEQIARLPCVAISNLRPTQMTIGKLQTEMKKCLWGLEDKDNSDKIDTAIRKHIVPVVRGADENGSKTYYLIDNHHFVYALYTVHPDDSVKVYVRIVANLSKLDPNDFWYVLDARRWSHRYDENGERCEDYKKIPKHIGKMKDDRFRSLAGALRRAGGFAKDTTPFSEFQWANFLRKEIPLNTSDTFDDMLKKAKRLARKKKAKYLPGWCGVSLRKDERSLLQAKSWNDDAERERAAAAVKT
jgi:hypothetical protein